MRSRKNSCDSIDSRSHSFDSTEKTKPIKIIKRRQREIRFEKINHSPNPENLKYLLYIESYK